MVRSEAETFLRLWDDALQRGMLDIATMYGVTAIRLGVLTEMNRRYTLAHYKLFPGFKI